MALIDCKECGNKVSDKAQACPKCGAPVELDQPEEKNEGEPKKKSKVGLFCGIGSLIVAVIVALFLLVPDLRFWEEDTRRSSRSHFDDSDDDVEYCKRDSAAKRDYVAIRDTAPERKPSMKVQEVRDLSGIYVGNVGKSEVQMTLYQYNHNINGSYIYTNVGNELNLSGYFYGKEITLSETTPKGNNSATWTLYPTSNGLEGSMYVYHTQKTHNVTLTRID